MKRALLLAGAALPAALVAAAPAASTPEPEQGRSVVLEPVRGDVEVRPAGSTRYRDLEARSRFPVGVTVDAQEGAVRLIVSRGDGKGVSRAVFSQGKFTVTQEREGDPIATLRLTGPSYAEVCDGATASAKRRKRVRRLWGDGKGSFRTSGRYSAATVRGTKWLTEDRCDGTITHVVRGEVRVDDFGALPTPTPEPSEPPAPPSPGAGEGGEKPAVRPVTDGSGDDVIVSAGGRYVARP